MHCTLKLNNTVGILEQRGKYTAFHFTKIFFEWGEWICINLKNYTHWKGRNSSMVCVDIRVNTFVSAHFSSLLNMYNDNEHMKENMPSLTNNKL